MIQAKIFHWKKKLLMFMKEHDYLSENIVDYEIKDDFIYVFTSTTQSGFSVAILKKTTDSIEWIMDEKSIQMISLGDPDENTPVLTVVQTDDPEVTGVKVLDEHAKLIQLTQDITEDYSTEVKYWIHFFEMTDDMVGIWKSYKEKESLLPLIIPMVIAHGRSIGTRRCSLQICCRSMMS